MIKNNAMRRMLAVLLTAGMIGGSAVTALAREDVPKKETEQIQTEETLIPDHTFFEEGSFKGTSVKNMEDAAAVVAEMTETMGGDGRTQFEPWRTLTDGKGNHYYVFRQMYSDVTVSGGAAKVVTDADGNMLGVVSSVESDLPDTEAKKGIPADEAQDIVIRRLKQDGHEKPQLLEKYTEKVILPVNLELDPDSEEEKEEVRFVWSVYTDNDRGSITGSSELPYLAHYVTMDGEYLYSLPTIIPGDEAGNAGFQSSYVFEFMESVPYTGEVTLSDGTKKTISISLMRDRRTGMYYLGNLERRIVVADCYEFLYNNGKVILEASTDNTGWDETCLLSLYNYCRAWDYYKEIGWTGGDGLGTPMMILKDFCDKDHVPVDNAAYAGSYYGWQVFLSSSVNDLSQCLDVLAHEFTHCVTGSVMTYNAYMNDYGAINEAISDIQGNLCEMMLQDTDDTTWELGENSSLGIRNMSDPHKYSQPEYVWDVYYASNVRTPTDINDRGGVHFNSSILNRIAYLLCEEGGMTLSEARDFWFAVDCSMVPGTDYTQLSELMPWVLENIGLETYAPALEKAMEKTRISSKELPEKISQDRAVLTLQLPETETFADGNWALIILSADADEIADRIGSIITGEGEYAGAIAELGESMLDAVWNYIFEDGGRQAFTDALADWVTHYFHGTLCSESGSAGQDGKTIRMVCPAGYTIPVLTYLNFEPNSTFPSGIGAAVLIGGEWIDLGSFVSTLVLLSEESGDPGEDFSEEQTQEIEALLDRITEIISSVTDPERELFFSIKGGETCEIPAAGLENAGIMDDEFMNRLLEEMSAAEETG